MVRLFSKARRPQFSHVLVDPLRCREYIYLFLIRFGFAAPAHLDAAFRLSRRCFTFVAALRLSLLHVCRYFTFVAAFRLSLSMRLEIGIENARRAATSEKSSSSSAD